MRLLVIITLALLTACGGGGDEPASTPEPAIEISLSNVAPNDDLFAIYTTPSTTFGDSFCGYQVGSKRIFGTVTKVHDGDTVTVGSQSIRLDSIDAPELAQTFGAQAQKTLENLLLGKYVTVAYTKLDRFGRTVGAVFTSDCTYASLRQVVIGLAWYYRAYQCEISADARNAFASAEDASKAANLGLWAGTATPPWVYRNGVSPAVPVCSASTPVWTGNPGSAPPVVFPSVPTNPTITTPTRSTTGSCYRVWVNGYTWANGTRVSGHFRNSPGCA